MTEVVFAIPVVPGKETEDREALDELAEGRREEYEAALREAGVTRQAVWHQQTPDGVLAIVLFETDSPEGPQRFVTSEGEVNQWFVDRMKVVHGVDISQEPPPPVEKVHDVRV